MTKINVNKETVSLFENFIVNNNPVDEICTSPKDRYSKDEAYKNIQTDTQNTLYIFGSSGFRSYYFYKSTNNKIYLVETYLDNVDAYSLYN